MKKFAKMSLVAAVAVAGLKNSAWAGEKILYARTSGKSKFIPLSNSNDKKKRR